MKSVFATIHNARALSESQIPILAIDTWRQAILDHCRNDGARVVALFGATSPGHNTKVFSVLGADQQKTLLIGATVVEGQARHYESLTPHLPEAHLFERELFEDFCIQPLGHPTLKPVRKPCTYPFSTIAGEDVHEVAVGPVHAGIIEPGHFRFQCHGETVLRLEICLGYQHRGVESLMVNAEKTRRALLAESIAGDTVIGHGLAFCQAMEGLEEEGNVSRRAQVLRGIVLELERLANHVGDLGALANDIGFLPASAWFARLRGEFLNLLMEITGNRYGRSFVRPGGVVLDMPASMILDVQQRLTKASEDLSSLVELFFGTSSVLSRLESTGTVSQEQARELGCIGMVAKASHLSRDVRQHYPFGIYQVRAFPIVTLSSGDVYARARLRSRECKRSLEYLFGLLDDLPSGAALKPSKGPAPSSLVVSLVEGWRGEIVHITLTDEQGKIARYKIIDPSFHNWPALEFAMHNGQISDFPLCNKSFNLSYAGHDL